MEEAERSKNVTQIDLAEEKIRAQNAWVNERILWRDIWI